jgi:hypothetical protein
LFSAVTGFSGMAISKKIDLSTARTTVIADLTRRHNLESFSDVFEGLSSSF